VSLGGFLAQIDDRMLELVEAEGVAEHPPRMRKPPRNVSARTVFAIREFLRPIPPTDVVAWAGSALGESGLGTSFAGIGHLYLSPTFGAEKSSLTVGLATSAMSERGTIDVS
jgi:hypothetical protein